MRVHRTDLVSFAFGLLFLLLSAWWLLAQVLGLVLPPVGWFLAGGLILIGVLGLVGALRSSRHSAAADEATAADPAGPSTGDPDAAAGASSATDPDSPTAFTPTDLDAPTPFRAADPDAPTGTWPDLADDRTTGAASDRTEPDDRTLDLPHPDDTSPPSPRGPAA